MRFELLFLGKTKEPYLAAGIADYAKRLARYIATDIKILKEKKIKKGTAENVRIANDSDILLQSTQGSQLVCLDRTGRQMDSMELAAQVESWAMQGQKKITFIIGGPLGGINSWHRSGKKKGRMRPDIQDRRTMNCVKDYYPCNTM